MKIGNLEVENLFGKINKENVYVGNLKKCTKYEMENSLQIEDFSGVCSFGGIIEESKDYIKNDVLIKFCDKPERYVRLEDLKNILSYISLYNALYESGISFNELFLSTSSSYLGNIYVDRDSLNPYYEEKGKVKVKQIKKDVLLDPRVKGKI